MAFLVIVTCTAWCGLTWELEVGGIRSSLRLRFSTLTEKLLRKKTRMMVIMSNIGVMLR
jgi:hypothetical protein